MTTCRYCKIIFYCNNKCRFNLPDYGHREICICPTCYIKNKANGDYSYIKNFMDKGCWVTFNSDPDLMAKVIADSL
jgi:hypothetical protein